MSETAHNLIPYTDFLPADLARDLQQAVAHQAPELTARHITGPVKRYGGSLSGATDAVAQGQRDHDAGVSDHYAVIDEAGNTIGAASVEDTALRRLRLPIRPRLAVGPLAVRFHNAGHNIKAWSTETGPERPALAVAYGGLVSIAESRRIHTGGGMTFTVEPLTGMTGDIIHDVLHKAGMQEVRLGYFDDKESGRIVPPFMALYAVPHKPGHTRHDLESDIRGGAMDRVIDMLEDASDYILGRRPGDSV